MEELDDWIKGSERERNERFTVEQKNLIVEFMEEHLDFALGKLYGPEGKSTSRTLWEILSTQLNNLDGPKRSTEKWKRVWIQIKNKTKKKAATIRLYGDTTGRGKPLRPHLTDIDKRVLTIMRKPETQLEEMEVIFVNVNEQSDPGCSRLQAAPGYSEKYYVDDSLSNPFADITSSVIRIDETEESATNASSSEDEVPISSRKRKRYIRDEEVVPLTSDNQFEETQNCPAKKSAVDKSSFSSVVVDTFSGPNQELNSKMDTIIDELRASRAEKIRNNEIMQDIANTLKLMLNKLNK